MVSIESAHRSPVAPTDRRIGHFDGENRDWSRAAQGSVTAALRASSGTTILPVLPDGTIIGIAGEATGSQ
ncbi:MAG TPA: hypothetical protein VIG76_13435 [Amnibacterium sp.]|jgi:hypothetical protein|uniref:hypothetical protein n=1 Tax=Amnibacterium sp. TaxID=1872496 RepID=UPI002F956913